MISPQRCWDKIRRMEGKIMAYHTLLESGTVPKTNEIINFHKSRWGEEIMDLERARAYQAMFDNLAELGLGCNDKAVISGNILEDEKVMGVHLAAGLSEHIGGTVGVDDFEDPANALHEDRVYPAGGEIEVTTLIFEYEDGSSETIIKDGRYTLFSES